MGAHADRLFYLGRFSHHRLRYGRMDFADLLPRNVMGVAGSFTIRLIFLLQRQPLEPVAKHP
jgi:hypothetical protein